MNADAVIHLGRRKPYAQNGQTNGIGPGHHARGRWLVANRLPEPGSGPAKRGTPFGAAGTGRLLAVLTWRTLRRAGALLRELVAVGHGRDTVLRTFHTRKTAAAAGRARLPHADRGAAGVVQADLSRCAATAEARHASIRADAPAILARLSATAGNAAGRAAAVVPTDLADALGRAPDRRRLLFLLLLALLLGCRLGKTEQAK